MIDVFRKVRIPAQKFLSFLETYFTGLTDFDVVWYSAISSGLPSNFQDNVIKVSRILKNIFNVLH
jgi:hypothetical protein